ncbi:MAG TPA: hypothetical protein VGD41_02985 [Pyrinomonadaceae bacterium]
MIRKNTFYCRYGVFKVRVSSDAHEKSHRNARYELAGLSKLNSVSRLHRRLIERRAIDRAGIEVDVVPGEPGCPDGRSHQRVRRLPE